MTKFIILKLHLPTERGLVLKLVELYEMYDTTCLPGAGEVKQAVHSSNTRLLSSEQM